MACIRCSLARAVGVRCVCVDLPLLVVIVGGDLISPPVFLLLFDLGRGRGGRGRGEDFGGGEGEFLLAILRGGGETGEVEAAATGEEEVCGGEFGGVSCGGV